MTEKRALQNCQMVAAAEIKRHDSGNASPQLTYAAWKHVLRLCEEAGIPGSVLREDCSKGDSSLVAASVTFAKSARKPSLEELDED
jgi:hypothetical protein